MRAAVKFPLRGARNASNSAWPYSRAPIREASPGFDEQRLTSEAALLAMDVELNAQGLGVWLDKTNSSAP